MVLFLAKEDLVVHVAGTGLNIKGKLLVQCTPLASYAVKVLNSNTPSSTTPTCNEIYSGLGKLRRWQQKLEHMFFQHQTLMILNTHNHKLDVNLKYTVGGAVYTVYASTEVQRCFSLFKSIRGEKTLALRFTSVEVGTVSNLVKGHQWK
ncbi:unnamed protein product [Lampetra planeri]